jgi:serine/threonine protein phosphatase 1
MIKKINKTNGRLFLVGDIHGMYKLLENILKKVNFNYQEDLIISTGDLVDRGLESHRAIEFLNYDWFESVLGNHEQMTIDVVESPNNTNISIWRQNGGMWETPEGSYEEYAKIFKTLPIAIECEYKGKKIGVNHAGIPLIYRDWLNYIKELSNCDKNDSIYDDSIWNRSTYYKSQLGSMFEIEGIDIMVSGHTPNKEILFDKNSLFIDTGAFCTSPKFNCGMEGKLTVIEIFVENDNLSFEIK